MAITDGGGVEHAALQTLEIGRHRGRLSDRILWVAVSSVVVATLLAMAVAYPLVASAAAAQSREQLSKQADTLAALLVNDELAWRGPHGQSGSSSGSDNDMPMPGRGMGGPNSSAIVFLVDSQTIATNPITHRDIVLVTAGADFSAVRSAGDFTYFLEGRSVISGQGVILVQRDLVASDTAATLLGRLAFALLVGLTLSVLLASYVARRTARPLKEAAIAAGRLAEGDRDVAVSVSGAEEVADIARALNRLAGALANSENRQREFLMSVSHELRTPMTSIKGYAEALADGVIEASDTVSTGEVLLAEGERLDRLVSDLLDLSRSGAVDFRLDIAPTDANVTVRQAAESWLLRCQKLGIEFESAIADGNSMIEADATRLRQVVDNLIENAVRVIPTGGRIRLATERTSSGLLIAVDDNGPGLSDEDIEIAFEPGVLNGKYRKERAVGTGLGLALVGRLAERMGARARAAHSELGGARFEIRFDQAD